MRGLLFSVFSATVYSGVLSQSTVTPASFAATEFDVVIVGGGTAGLVLANRLSATSLNVGLIDAGHYNESGDDTIDIPTGFLTTDLLSNDDYVWPLASVPQSRLNDRSISYPRFVPFVDFIIFVDLILNCIALQWQGSGRFLRHQRSDLATCVRGRVRCVG